MPIAFRNVRQIEGAGTAAFLKLIDGPGTRTVALFQVNARGEPAELVYSTAAVKPDHLWREGDLEHATLCELVASVMAGAGRSPVVLLALASELPENLLRDEIQVRIPACRIATPSVSGVKDHLVDVLWLEPEPGVESPARRLVSALSDRGLLLEPFDRAQHGVAAAWESAAPRT